MTPKALLNRFKKLDTDSLLTESFSETLPQLVEINKKQLYAGYGNTGKKISKKYKRAKYARVKHEMNPTPGLGTPDIFVTGEYYSELKGTMIGDDIAELHSTDEKAQFLEQKYDDILGLGGEYKSEHIRENLRPTVHEKITKHTGLKFKTR